MVRPRHSCTGPTRAASLRPLLRRFSVPGGRGQAPSQAAANLRMKLTTRLVTRNAKRLRSLAREQGAGLDAGPPGVNRLHWRVAVGGSSGDTEASPPLAGHLSLSPSDSAALKELGGQVGTDKAGLFLAFSLRQGADVQEVQSLVQRLNAASRDLVTVVQEVFPPLRKAEWAGPLSTGPEPHSGKIILLKAFFTQDPLASVCKALAAPGGGEAGAANHTTSVLKFAGLTLGVNHSLEQLLGLHGTDAFSPAELAAFEDGSAFLRSGQGLDTAPLSFALETCVDLDRQALVRAAAAARALLRSQAGMPDGPGAAQDFDEEEEEEGRGGGGFFSAKKLARLLQVVSAWQEDTLTFDVPDMASLLRFLRKGGADEGVLDVLPPLLASVACRASLATAGVGSLRADLGPAQRQLWRDVLHNCEALTRVGVQTREVLLALDLRGLLLSAVLGGAAAVEGAAPSASPGGEEVEAGLVVLGPHKAGSSSVTRSLVGAVEEPGAAGYSSSPGQVHNTPSVAWQVVDVGGCREQDGEQSAQAAAAAVGKHAGWSAVAVAFVLDARRGRGEGQLPAAARQLRATLARLKEGGQAPPAVAVLLNKADTYGPKVTAAQASESLRLAALQEAGLLAHSRIVHTSAASGRGLVTAMRWLEEKTLGSA